MQDEKLTPDTFSAPEIPYDAFILDPATYKLQRGKLEFTDSPASKKSRKWGYILLALAAIQFLFFAATARNFGSVALAIVFGLFLGGIGLALVNNGRKHLKYKKNSRFILGELEAIEARLIEQNYRQNFKKKQLTSNLIIASYKFTTPEGTELSDIASFDRVDLIDHRLPRWGTPVVVLYQNPKKYMLC